MVMAVQEMTQENIIKRIFKTVYSFLSILVFFMLILTDILLASIFHNKATKQLLSVVLNSGVSVEEVTRLIQEGANVNAKGMGRSTPLMFAASCNKNPDVLRLLVEKGANVNAIDRRRMAPLNCAAANSNIEILRVLVENGANVNSANMRGMTPLIEAAFINPKPDFLQVLLKHGANVNAVDKDGKTALISAAARNPNPVVLQTLLDSGADVAVKDKEGKTALDYAEGNENLKGTDALKLLREKTLSGTK